MIQNKHKLHSVLQDWPKWPVLNQFKPKACHFEPLEKGLTNENWLVSLPSAQNINQTHIDLSQKFVIRINAKNAAALHIDHKSECEIVETIHPLNLCPSVIYSDPNLQYWVRPYIEGQTLAEISPSKLEQNNTIERAAKTLKAIHRQPAKTHWPEIKLLERTEHFWHQLFPNPSINTSRFLDLKHNLDISLGANTTDQTLCHMDPNTNNWILDNHQNLQLIDWEYAGIGNPIWDLAVFSDSAKLNQQQERKLLKSYEKYSLVELKQAKFEMEYLSILWFAVQDNTDANTLFCELNNLNFRAQQSIIQSTESSDLY